MKRLVMTDEELLQVPHHRNIPADLVELLLQRIHDGRVKTGSTAQVFVNDAPTVCDWCFDRIVGDAWMECDAWHLCRPCYRALTDSSDLREFRQRRPAKVHPTNCGPCVDCKLAIDMFAQNIANETDEEILRSIRHEGITTKMTMNIDIPWDFYPNEDKFGRTFAPDSLDLTAFTTSVELDRSAFREFDHIPSYTSIGFVPMSYAQRSRDRRRQVRRFARAEAMMSMPAREWYLRVSGRARAYRKTTEDEGAVIDKHATNGGEL